MFPIMIDLKEKKCIVIGGGRIAYRKTLSLLKSGGTVTVISPELCEELQNLLYEDKIKVQCKEAEPSDYKDAFMIIAATNSEAVNKQIAANTHSSQLVNVASNHELGNFHIPASVRRGKLVISISTSGASPLLAKKIRDDLADSFDDKYNDYLDFLFEARQIIIHSSLSQVEKKECLKEIVCESYKSSPWKRRDFLKRFSKNEL